LVKGRIITVYEKNILKKYIHNRQIYRDRKQKWAQLERWRERRDAFKMTTYGYEVLFVCDENVLKLIMVMVVQPFVPKINGLPSLTG
jgi:hypothetical protein